MINTTDIIEYMNKCCPESLAEVWDNVGLLIGRADKDIKKVLLTLDVDLDVAREAVENKVDMIISHHPVIFNPLKSITDQDNEGKMIYELIKNDISVYSAHTNLDVSNGGLNDYAAKLLGITIEGKLCDETSLGRYGYFDKEYTLNDILKLCKNIFKNDILKFVGDKNKIIKKVAIVTGSGMSEIDKCYEKDVDLFITGDVKYSGAREGYQKGLSIIDAGHYGTEIIVVDLLYDILSEQFPTVEFIKTVNNTNIFDTI